MDREKVLTIYRPFQDTEKAKEHLSALCSGDKPTMRIPPDVDDYDMVFLRLIKKCEEIDCAALTEAPKVDVEKDLNWIKERVQNARDKLNKTIEEIIELETKVIQATTHYDLVKKESK